MTGKTRRRPGIRTILAVLAAVPALAGTAMAGPATLTITPAGSVKAGLVPGPGQPSPERSV